MKIPCERLACSQEAGEWLFGSKQDFRIINNAIDCDRFQFENATRSCVRKDLQFEDKLVIGHVGRFEDQKNHFRMLKIFKAILDKRQSYVLVLIGTGSLQEQCIELASKLGISNHIAFLGSRSDVPELMQAFDLFLLPSIYEGFPFVLVEAQASGLTSIASTNVPSECNVTGNVHFVDLAKNDSEWAEYILKCQNSEHDRSKYAGIMKKMGYDINQNAKMLCTYYEGLE